MKNKTYTLSTVLTAVLAVVLAAMVLVRAFAPQIILPVFDIPTLTAISLVALVLDHYLAKGARRCWICIPVFAALSFGILPFAAGMVALSNILGLALTGAVIFTICTFVFTSVQDRLSSGPAARLAPIMSALGIWLAVQAFAGIGF
jgi:hypothetical protein